MFLTINTNVMSLNAQRNLWQSQHSLSKSMQRLSSGVRINSAKDDAAGLAISDRMTAQIRGLNQASRNANDGISFVQTADGALSEMTGIVQRMRELCVQGGNDTLNHGDRIAVQAELDQLHEELSRITTATEFNSKKLLTSQVFGGSLSKNVSGTGETDIVFIIDKTGSMDSVIDNVEATLESFVTELQNNNVNVRLGLVTYGDIQPAEGGDALVKTDFTEDLNQFKSDIAAITVSGGGDIEESGLEGIADSSNGALSFTFRPGASKQFILVTDAKVHDANEDGESSYTVSEVAETLATKGISLSIIGPIENETQTQLEPLANATDGSYLNINDNFGPQLESLASVIAGDSGVVLSDARLALMPTHVFQVGSNGGESITVQLNDMRPESLGLTDDYPDVSSIDSANESLGILDGVIIKISSQRAYLGAVQNRFEHTISNLQNMSENLSAARSRILDTDIAAETSAMTKQNILQQAGVSIITQANQVPQLALSLLG